MLARSLAERALALIRVPSVIGHEQALANEVEAWALRRFERADVSNQIVECDGDVGVRFAVNRFE